MLANNQVWLAGIVFLFYGPIEGALGTWTTTLLTNMGFRERRAVWLLSGFWLTFLLARLATYYFQHHDIPPTWGNPWLILVLGLLAAIFLGNLAQAPSRIRAALGLLGLGACLGPIFPTLVGIIFQDSRLKQQPGTAYGAMFAIGATGSLLLPPLIGAFARRRRVQTALHIPMILALLMAAAALVLALGAETQNHSDFTVPVTWAYYPVVFASLW